mmetsp:Transcript_10056/g.31852  ORF Transcript_10056/g.31852 Transcript_10056/m.31852 type:complete len:261 (+) Transcript_10056:320-1102(+)
MTLVPNPDHPASSLSAREVRGKDGIVVRHVRANGASAGMVVGLEVLLVVGEAQLVPRPHGEVVGMEGVMELMADVAVEEVVEDRVVETNGVWRDAVDLEVHAPQEEVGAEVNAWGKANATIEGRHDSRRDGILDHDVCNVEERGADNGALLQRYVVRSVEQFEELRVVHETVQDAHRECVFDDAHSKELDVHQHEARHGRLAIDWDHIHHRSEVQVACTALEPRDKRNEDSKDLDDVEECVQQAAALARAIAELPPQALS